MSEPDGFRGLYRRDRDRSQCKSIASMNRIGAEELLKQEAGLLENYDITGGSCRRNELTALEMKPGDVEQLP
jgi:hypothetical protein